MFMTYTAVRLLADAIERAKSADRAADHRRPEPRAPSATTSCRTAPRKFENGQNMGAQPLMTQVIKGDIRVIVPREYREAEPLFPLRGLSAAPLRPPAPSVAAALACSSSASSSRRSSTG
jgi:branched-chain amino acid transport system substrate-binding protein